MFPEILLAVFVGCLLGVVTGLVPGVHINLVAAILLSASPFLLQFINPITLAALIVAMSIAHTFLDFIPSVYLGIANEDTAMGALPGHKMLLSGMAHEAVKLTVIGGILGLATIILAMPAALFIVPGIYSGVEPMIGWILLFFILFLILNEADSNSKFWSFFIFMLSGVFGIFALGIPNVPNALFPMLAGLFGVSLLINGLNSRIILPEQDSEKEVRLPKKLVLKSSFAGALAASMVSIFPGLGPAQAAALVEKFFRRMGDYGYLIVIGCINTVSMVFALITTYTIGKARNGSIVAVDEITGIGINELALFVAVSVIAACFAAFLTLKISRIFCRAISRVNYRLLCVCVICFVIILTVVFSGFIGLLILSVATSIGMLSVLLKTPKSYSMGCLLLPVILWFLM